MNQTQTRSLRKKVLSLILAVVMVVSLLPISAFASGNSKASTAAATDEFVRIFHLDCGRKYFSVDQIKDLIDAASASNYTHVELAIGNDALRFLLDDMSVTANGTTYSSEKVKSGIQTGNKAYYNAGSVNELTQSEMDTIISYAKGKNISIIPLLNSPGHMDAIIDCMESLDMKNVAYTWQSGWQTVTSDRTIDVTNTAAVEFTQALLQKYIAYFADKGCEYFNMGADEYANDVHTSGSMGFGNLQTTGKYSYYVTYVNKVAEEIKNAKMKPMAFNDGIYFKSDTSAGNFDKDIVICYWTTGFNSGAYAPASASFLVNKGHKVINTNDAWYYVLGRRSGTYPLSSAQNGTKNTGATSVPGQDATPIGCMLCLWCDTPSANYTTTEVNNVKDLISELAKNNPDQFTKVMPTGPEITTANGSTALDLNGSTTLTISGVADGATVTWTVTPENVVKLLSVENAAGDTITGTSVTAVAVGTGTATVTATVDGKQYSTTLTVTDPKTKDVTVAVGKTHTETVDGTNLTGNYTTEDESIATVTVTGQDGTPETTKDTYTAAKVSYGTLAGSHTSWTKTDYFYKVGDNYYPVYAKRESTYFGYYYYYGYFITTSDTDSPAADSDIHEIGESHRSGSTVTVYTKKTEKVDATPASTTIVFTGVAVGTTSVKIGDVTYRIKVTDKAPDNAMTASTINLEYWITNFEVYKGTDTYTEHKRAVSSSEASSDAGIAITDIAPNHAYSFFDGTKDVYYWQAMRLDKDNQQTNVSGDDETADGTTLTHIRYHSGAWQYKTTDGVWHYFVSTDQLVAYYLQQTEVTKEVVTYAKDWGYGTDSETPNTSSGKGQVALTVAVVYPDGTVSPAEGSMYASSTTIFNYWDGRDIGIVAPKNNSDYNISKITVTDGKRDSNSSSNVWYTTDTITWNKKTNVAGEEWYDETEVWNKSSGTTPMVNGKTSNITWSAKNTAKLVLIYLEPVEKKTNLNVQYIDLNANNYVFHSYQVAMKYNQGDDVPTFTKALMLGNTVIGGKGPWNSNVVGNTNYLPDEAYVTNSSNTKQTFRKDITTIPEINGIYASGLYKYMKADISEDGKTLRLYYDLNATGGKTFVVDFGLPVEIPFDDFGITNASSNVTVSFDANDTKKTERTGNYGVGKIDMTAQTVTYTLYKTLDAKAPIPVYVSDGKNTLMRSVNIIPATSVYYEDSFATFTNANGTKNVAQVDNGVKGIWTKVTDGTTQTNVNQALEELGGTTNTKNVYGYDPAYAASSKFSMGSATKVTVAADTYKEGKTQWPTATFSFKGTGFDVISLTNSDSGTVVYTVTNKSNGVSESHIINNYYGYRYDETTGKWVVANNDSTAPYQVPVIKVSGLAYDTYEVTISVIYGALFDNTGDQQYSFWLDAIRVYDPAGATLDTEYAKDNENAPNYVRIKQVILDSKALETEGATGAVFIDGKGANGVTATDYKNQGPNHEAYLANGQAIAFQLIANDKPTSVQIGAKLASGNSAGLKIGGAACAKAKDGTLTLNTATDMYYELTDMGWTQSDGVYKSSVITLTNAGSGIISLTNLKFIGAEYTASLPEVKSATSETNLVTLAVSSEMIDEALTTVDGALNPAPETFEPSHFEADWNRSVRAGQKATLTVKTSEDVDAITVDGQTITTYRTRTERTGWGWWSPRVTYRVFTYTTTAQATADYEVCALNSSGVASEPITATLTVKPAINWWHKWF